VSPAFQKQVHHLCIALQSSLHEMAVQLTVLPYGVGYFGLKVAQIEKIGQLADFRKISSHAATPGRPCRSFLSLRTVYTISR
jgi:hypothetical protein